MKNVPAYILTLLVIVVSALLGLLLKVPFWKGLVIAFIAIVLISTLNSMILLAIYNLKKILDGKSNAKTV